VLTAYLVFADALGISAISQMQTWQRDNKLPILPVSALRRPHFLPFAHCLQMTVCLWCVQMCRALAHIHSMQVCHRDIKPQNLLVNTQTHQLKLCDFGSAKVLMKGEPNISYICSRSALHPPWVQGSVGPFFCQLAFCSVFAQVKMAERRDVMVQVLSSPRVDLWGDRLHSRH